MIQNLKIKFAFGFGMLFLALFSLSSCKAKCPLPTENIPGTSTFRDDCPYQESEDANGGVKDLNFWIVYDNTDAFREQIQAFQSKFPNIKVYIKKFNNLKEYEDLIVNEIAEDEGPDVFMVHNSWMPKHYKKLYPLPLDQPIVMNADLFRQTFFQSASDDLIIDDQVYGMPLAIDNLAVFYNKQHFKDLIATSDKPGALWENIKEQVASLTKRNNSPERFALSGMALGRADNLSSAVDIFYAMMLEYGVKFYDEKEENATFAMDKGGVNSGNPGVQALELFTSFALPSYRNYSWNEYITGFSPKDKEIGSFVRGKVSMIIAYPYIYNEIQRLIQEQQKSGSKHIDISDVAVSPFPQLVSGDEATKRDTYASYFPLVVSRTTGMPAEAWSFVQFLTSSDALQTYHKITKRPSSRKDMVSEEQTDPLFGSFAFQTPFAKSFKIYDDSAYKKVFSDAIQDVVNNVSTAKQALTVAQQKITCILQKEKGITDLSTDCGI